MSNGIPSYRWATNTASLKLEGQSTGIATSRLHLFELKKNRGPSDGYGGLSGGIANRPLRWSVR